MKPTHLVDLPIEGMDQVFSPPGLPLVPKSERALPTTSILVRGGPGTGKTSLAVALGYAIAKVNGGAVLYLESEAATTELVFKAALLGLPDEAVLAWKDRAQAQVGSLLAHHLVFTRSGEEVETTLQQRHSLLAAVDELLAEYPGEPVSVPVRAVVIDAFGLLQKPGEDPHLRGEVLALVQDLESQGVSPILIEEIDKNPEESLAFVMDLVFRISFELDPDPGEYIRKIACTKSRYVRARPGPHDYGLNRENRPAVWTDLLGALDPSWEIPQERRVHMLVAGDEDGQYFKLSGGLIAISSSLGNILAKTPGSRLVLIQCGALIIINDVRIDAASGPHAIAWALLHMIREGNINTFLVEGLDLLRHRMRFRTSMLHVLEALRRLGAFIVLNDVPDKLEGISSLADFRSQGHFLIRTRISFKSRPHRPAFSWIPNLPVGEDYDPDFVSDPGGLKEAEESLVSCVLALEQGEPFAPLRTPPFYLTRDKGVLPETYALRLRYAQMIGRHGSEGSALLQTMLFNDPSVPAALHPALAWTHALLGRDGEALKFIMRGFTEPKISDELRILFWGLCAIYTPNEEALISLRSISDPAQEKLAIGLLLRALCERERREEARVLIDNFAGRYSLASYITRRLQAELALEGEPDPARLGEALRDLTELFRETEVPRLHRAEIAHNLGVIAEQLGEKAAAIAHFQNALSINPFLDPARVRLLALGEHAEPPPHRAG